MDCHYDHPADREPLWIGVYWRAKDDWGKYVYHPDDESIQPHYRGRTRLVGNRTLNRAVSLCINNVTEMDSQTYYCLVVFRFCSGVNVFTSVIQQGEGTTLSIQEPSDSITHTALTTNAGIGKITDGETSTGNNGSDWNKTYSFWLVVAAALPIKLAVTVLLMCFLVRKHQERDSVGDPSVDRRSRGREE